MQESIATGISFLNVSIDNGFWNKRQSINAEKTIYALQERFKETGHFNAFNFKWEEGAPDKPNFFWDSDIAKWMESAAYILIRKPDETLENAIDELVDLVELHQDKNGYFNIYFTVVDPESRFEYRGMHELYCAGNLIEAAVAYYQATGKDKFLNLMRKYADYIEKVFRIDHSASFTTCGHEEIELALVKLYHATGEKRYLDLSKFFIDNRGKEKIDYTYLSTNAYYAQDHLPVREQSTAEGHAVRAVYLYCAMADLAREYGDKELFAACKQIFENIATRRMYVTGGIGSTHEGEAFTIDYDLPNLGAYSETCASFGLAHFARRMLYLDADSLYADVTERVLYNGFLSGVSLDGKAFFYTNPLEIHPEQLIRDTCMKNNRRFETTFTQRWEMVPCACCPPNVTRLIASIGDFLYTSNQETLYVHHYMNSTAGTPINGMPMEIIQQTNYPSDGNVALTVKGNGISKIAFRIPYWCESYNFKLNGNKADVKVQKGYAYFDLASHETNTIDVAFDMNVQLIEASPNVQENSGRVAIQRGPVIYCLEAVDNGSLLRDVRIDPDASYELIPDEYFGLPVIKTTGYRRKAEDFRTSLYKPVSRELGRINLKFIPYFGFANRGESEMIVWVLKT
jgi:uncharacterized protein